MLLSLPDEIIIQIAEWLYYRDPSGTGKWRSSVVDNLCEMHHPMNFGLKSLFLVNRRLSNLVLRFRLRAVCVSTRQRLLRLRDYVARGHDYAPSVRFIRFECREPSLISQVLAKTVNLSTLRIHHPCAADQDFFQALAQCKGLKHLYITTIDERSVHVDVPDLQDLKLESASFCAFPDMPQFASSIPRATDPIRPIHTILSGNSRYTLRFLHCRRATERMYLHSNATLPSPIQRLEHVIPDNVIFYQLSTLKFSGVNSSDYWLGQRSQNFPSLRTLVMGEDPVPAIASPEMSWPQLRCLIVSRLTMRDWLFRVCPFLRELTIFDPMTRPHLLRLKGQLESLSPSVTSSLKLVSLNVPR